MAPGVITFYCRFGQGIDDDTGCSAKCLSQVLEPRCAVRAGRQHNEPPEVDAASFCVGRMRTMPKKIDPQVKERCVRQALEHLAEYPSITTAAESVARREGLGKETVRRWVVQAQIDGGQRQGASREELARSGSSKRRFADSKRTTRSCAGPRFSSRGPRD